MFPLCYIQPNCACGDFEGDAADGSEILKPEICKKLNPAVRKRDKLL